MTYDFKKEFKEQYPKKTNPNILEIPNQIYISVKGKGNPNDKDGAYAKAVQNLYAIAYTIKMSKNGTTQLPGYFDFVVPPLEGFWWQTDLKGVDYSRKDDFEWISLLRMPEFVDETVLEWAKKTVIDKKELDTNNVTLLHYDEGMVVQCLHIGSYDNEPETVAKMNSYLKDEGYEIDLSEIRHHHEIYMSDPRKTSIEKLKTIIRHPIKKIS